MQSIFAFNNLIQDCYIILNLRKTKDIQFLTNFLRKSKFILLIILNYVFNLVYLLYSLKKAFISEIMR